jgi:RNA polymerase sigma factor (sigma-70 family)
MTTNPISDVLQHLRGLLRPDGAELTDGQLLECFVSRREPTALEALVRRHGSMVWGVCRRVLGNHHDAEDAFQATFLVLVRKAASIRSGTQVGNWLYGVALQTARKARATRAKRRLRETQVKDMPEPAVPAKNAASDLQAVLDQELSRLPEKYRTVIVLCDLEGNTNKEAARQLRVPQGTVASRLARGRLMLAKRLARHGLRVSGSALAAVLAEEVASASAPSSVLISTIKAVTLVAAGQAEITGLVSTEVAALTKGVMKIMLLKQMKSVTAVLLTLAILCAGGGLRIHRMVHSSPDQRAAISESVQEQKDGRDSGENKKASPAAAGEKEQANKNEKENALADFASLYALKPGEILKRVGTPFPPSRFVYHRQHYPKDDKAQDMMFLRWDNGLNFCGTLGGIKNDPRKVQLAFLLRNLPSMIGDFRVLPVGGRELDVRGDPELLRETVEGDFVARSNVPFEKIVARMGEILRDECKLPVRLTLQQDRGAFTLLVERQGEIASQPSSSPISDKDFQARHKYFTESRKKSTAGKEMRVDDWNERRQYTYSIRSIMRVMPPYNLQALNDDYQDVRVRKETKDFVELEVISYPLNTNADTIPENRNWKHDYKGSTEYLTPGVTTNWDKTMQKDLLAELAKSGVYPDQLSDKQVVEQVSRWLLGRCKYRSMAFTTMYADFREGKPVILPGLEKAFEREKSDPTWTVEEQFAHELFGKGMFSNRLRGSCTSSAVLMATVLRALGIPTRIIVAIPIVDPNDPEQLAMVKNNLRHNQVRTTILNGLLRVGKGFANHTYNEVYVGHRWRRLNYAKLGQNILDEDYFGLMIHVHTFNDLSEAKFAPTWGRRYALGLRDEQFKFGNPYRTLEISDLFGRESKIPNPPAEEHKAITITKAYWLESKETPEVIRQGARRPKQGEGHLYLHAEEWFANQDKTQYLAFLKQVDRNFVFRAMSQPDVKGQVQLSFWVDGRVGLREILLAVPKSEYVKMAKGVAYTIHPINSTAGYQWTVKDGLTISREGSLEEKFDRLQQKVDKLEQRVEELERNKAIK